MLQNCRPRRNIKSFHSVARVGGEKPGMVAKAAILSTVEIVERHFGKHTGLRHSAKACPWDLRQCKPAARLVVVEAQAYPTAPRRGRVFASIREKAHGGFVR